MTRYREILRLHSMNLSQSNIAYSCGASKTTVNSVIKRANDLGVSWPLDENQTDGTLSKLLFPSKEESTQGKRLPDFDYIRKELVHFKKSIQA